MPDEQPDIVVQGLLPGGEESIQSRCGELIRENQALRAANEKLQRASEMHINFVSMAVHELRNPLNPIAGYVEMLLEGVYGQISAEQSETLVVVQRNLHRLENITVDLLDMVQIEAGRIALDVQPINLAALMEAVVVEHRSQSEARKQLLTLLAPPDLPHALCDEARTRQILVNLLSNASNNMPNGGHIAVTLERAQDEDFLLVTMTSSAPGQQAYIAGSASPHLAGVWAKGLGLHVTRLLVELHGGQIRMEHQPGVGNSFYLTFPIAP